jgi:hypothetical protein
MSVNFPDNVRIVNTTRTTILSISSAPRHWMWWRRMLWRLMVGSFSLMMVGGFIEVGEGALQESLQVLSWTSFAITAPTVVLVVLHALCSVRHTNTTLILQPDHLMLPGHLVPLEDILGIQVHAVGRHHELVLSTAQDTLRIARHRDAAPLRAVQHTVEEWQQAHQVVESGMLRRGLPSGVRQEGSVGAEHYVLTAPSTRSRHVRLALFTGLIFSLIFLRELSMWSDALVFSPFVIVALMALLHLRQHLSAAHITLHQRILKTQKRTLSLESIQKVWLRSEGRDEALVVSTADDEIVLGRSEAVDPLLAVLVPLQHRVRARRAAVLAAGTSPDASVEIPIDLQALRQRSR